MKKMFAFLATLIMLCGMFTACGNVSTTYANYVQAVMDCTYHGDTTEYITLTGATEQQAQFIYDNEIRSVVSLICQKFDVDVNCLSEDTYEKYAKFSRNLLNQISYHAEPSIKTGNGYQVTLTAQPPKIWDTVFSYIEDAYVSDYLPRFAKISDKDSAQFKIQMSNWGKKVIAVLNEHFEEITFEETKYITIQIQPDENGKYNISEYEWLTVDRFLLGLE